MKKIIDAGTGPHRRNVDVNRLHNFLGPKAESLIALHALTGTDISGKFSGISKLMSITKFLHAPNGICDRIKILGDADATVDVLYNNIVPFICYLYDTPCNTIEDARWYRFLKEAVPESMPPTSDALKKHILRAHLVANIWKNALSPHQTPLDPLKYGWKLDKLTDQFEPIMTTTPLCPAELMKITKCNCKGGCKTLRCSCKKQKIPCTEMCGCHLGETITCENLRDIYKENICTDSEDSDSEDSCSENDDETEYD